MAGMYMMAAPPSSFAEVMTRTRSGSSASTTACSRPASTSRRRRSRRFFFSSAHGDAEVDFTLEQARAAFRGLDARGGARAASWATALAAGCAILVIANGARSTTGLFLPEMTQARGWDGRPSASRWRCRRSPGRRRDPVRRAVRPLRRDAHADDRRGAVRGGPRRHGLGAVRPRAVADRGAAGRPGHRRHRVRGRVRRDRQAGAGGEAAPGRSASVPAAAPSGSSCSCRPPPRASTRSAGRRRSSAMRSRRAAIALFALFVRGDRAAGAAQPAGSPSRRRCARRAATAASTCCSGATSSAGCRWCSSGCTCRPTSPTRGCALARCAALAIVRAVQRDRLAVGRLARRGFPKKCCWRASTSGARS